MTWEGDICPVCQQPSETKRDYVTVDHFDCVLKLKAELDAERKKRCRTCKHRAWTGSGGVVRCAYRSEYGHQDDFCVRWKESDE